ncbi:MAG: outer membrane protein assembly factor BamB family protein [Planctomycetota bacterium]|jgi:outer membrane protein assembly factor BamB
MAVVAVFLTHSTLAYANWPDWRGPTGDGRSDATDLPLNWSETENVVWKTRIHDFGHSTPVVWGDQVWLTTATKDGRTLYAVCIDLNSGRVVRDVEVFHPDQPQRIHANNTYATPSAVVEEGCAYVHFGTFGTAALDSQTGAVLWRRTDLNCEHMQGPVSSPVLFEDLLIVHLEGTDVQFIAALDTKTGDTVWRFDRPEDLYGHVEPVFLRKAYHTPVLVEVDGRIQLVSNGALLVTGHEPRTGKELWRVLYRDDNTISRIVSGHGLLFINCGGPPNATHLWAVRQGGAGDVTNTHVAWKMTEDVPLESSPVLVGDLLYTMSDGGVLICKQAMTGETVWRKRLRGRYGASLLYADNRIYISSKQGKTTVIEPGRVFREVAVNELDGEHWASPVVAGDSLLFRTKTHLYRVQSR